MATFRPWAFWRRLQYGVGFAAFWSLIGGLMYMSFFYMPPNCFDGLQNGDETGVDCGGRCVLICANTVTLPSVVWAESFKIENGQYNAVAYVENKNKLAATPNLEYTFKLFDGDDLIAEQSGVTVLPPDSVYPIFEGRIMTTDARVPTRTEIDIKPTEKWLPVEVGRNQFKTVSFDLENVDNRPRLNVTLENLDLKEAKDIEVVATIFNNAGRPVTASQTFVDSIGDQSTKDISFTWPNPIATTVRSCDVPSDVVLLLDRSGSMAADGGDPPEPLESAKLAAVDFVDLLRSDDMAGFVSYATTPKLEQVLTNNFSTVKASIMNTKMGEDGVQYTNTGDALDVALTELTSQRHRSDARKVLIFLTDGDITRPVNPATGEPDPDNAYAIQYAYQASDRVKAADVAVYTIGLGDFFSEINPLVNRDVGVIKNLASSPSNYFEAPTIKDLELVYSKIASDICETGPTRIEIIPKIKTNFPTL